MQRVPRKAPLVPSYSWEMELAGKVCLPLHYMQCYMSCRV
jgi:hypothetical protein